MKTTLLSLLLLCTCVLAAQSSSKSSYRSVTESVNEDSYAFSVKLDKKQSDKLLPIFKELTGMNNDIVGEAISDMSDDLTISINTRRGKLAVRHTAGDERGRAIALKMVTLIKERLDITPPPSPPTPPKQ